MSLFEIKLWKTIAAAERYYTISTTTHQKVISRTLEWTENYPRKLTIQLDNRTLTATDNLVSASFNGWDTGAVGPIDVGDRIEYSVYMTSNPGVATVVFWGIITEVSQTSGGILTLIAKDYLEKYEYIQPNLIHYKNYRDRVVKPHTDGGGVRSINSVSDSDIVQPAIFVGFATTDTSDTLGDGTDEVDSVDTFDFDIAQSFVSMGDAVIGCLFYYYCPGLASTLRISLQTDDGNNAPSGNTLQYFDVAISAGPRVLVEADFSPVSIPAPVEKGCKYWLVFRQTSHENTCQLKAQDPVTGTLATDYWKRPYAGGAWALSGTTKNIFCAIHYANYDEVSPADYYFDIAASKVIVRWNSVPITTVDSYYSIYRGMVSYYYGTLTTEEIFTELIESDWDMDHSVDSDCDTTYSLYQTRGKSLGECFRELCDTFETTGARSGYQHIIAAYLDGADNVIQVGFRTNPDGRTFSHGADSTTDDELRIASVNLKRTVNLRPASVVVIGKGASGAPIIVQRDDRALATSFRTQSKLQLTTTHTDESINTLAEADRKAWQILDSYTRGTWEGSITVAGVFPDLFDLDTASESYGAGGHIDLNYSPLGIVAQEFHVRGIVLHENTTEIQITNEDILLTNALTDARGRAERSESFIAPDDPFNTVFVSGYYNGVEAAATMYMDLCTLDETPITDRYRVLCTRTTNSRYNDVTYHAEFATYNGHTLDSGNDVYQLELWDAITGGDHHAKVALNFGEQFPKWRTTRVIAEIHCKAA